MAYQATLTHADAYCGTDHAGCIRTRKPTSGGVLSSCAAEFYGLVTIIPESSGLKSYAEDLGLALEIRVRMDATAGAAIGIRRGLAKIKYIDTAFRWVEENLRTGAAVMHKARTP